MSRTLRARFGAGLLGLALLLPIAAAAPTRAAAADFPAGFTGYHTYAEMVAEVNAVVAAHPTIARKVAVGTSYQGRTIWAVKISDNVATDEPEPEVLFDGLTHADEHMGLEMTIKIMRWLTDGYGQYSRIRNIVNSREVWIILAVNPDGAEYDIKYGKFHFWRKNRQPNAGTTAIGTDLNRNYSYRWGCCGGSSGSPSSIIYRGRSSFSAPETVAFRNFVLSRIVGGIQQIKAHITFHTNGQLILWPYGYTKTDIPVDMTSADHAAFVTMGRAMAARNGYKAEQSSDLYITDGDQIDWMYGSQRIFSFTWELYPPETSTVWGDHYPADETIATQTARNRSALLYFLTVGWCPHQTINRTSADCGPFYDDTEIARGWVVNPDGTDTAPAAGRFVRGNPAPTSINGIRYQPDAVVSGRYAFVTGLAGPSATAYDLDGVSTIRSVPIALPANPGVLSFRYVFAHRGGSSADGIRVWVEDDAGTRTLVWSKAGAATTVGASWVRASAALTPWAGTSVRIVIQARDGGGENIVEVLIDDIRVERKT